MTENQRIAIVIAPNGWVWVGLMHYESDLIVLEKVRNIRRWGTVEGLLELAEKGPQRETKLDGKGRRWEQHILGAQVITCNEAVWASHLD